MAKSVALPLAPEVTTPSHWAARAFVQKVEVNQAQPKDTQLTFEDAQVVKALNEAASDMAYIHSCFDHITEELLIDCLIYELKAAQLRHKYFLDLCKEKNIVGGVTA